MGTTVNAEREASSERISPIAKDLQDVGSATKRIAVDSFGALRQTAHGLIDKGRTKTREVSGGIQRKFQDQPVKSVLLAGAIGFLLGIVWMRR
jgi:ElaB/YqjD/DUF883 family membrane-anchored ribosome-binding protein